MKIGDFAKACDVPVSVLRFYDNEGLLKPVYIDKFTGYRYYTESQIAVCARINMLKSCGFSLVQIKQLLECGDKNTVDCLFEARRQELNGMLLCLEETKETIMQNEIVNEKISFPHRENIDLPFENDENVVGKWKLISGKTMPIAKNLEIYFLPGGEAYWCYGGWTKGLLFFDDGYNTSASRYTLEERDDGLYMIVEYRSYDCWNGGEPEIITLKKLDSVHYKRYDISVTENIDLPFKNDEKVLGKWVAHDFIERKEDFTEKPVKTGFEPYFKAIEFLPDGECISVYGDEVINNDSQSWTKGYHLRKFNQTACAYEIMTVNGKDYLIMEWKSGDYRWGGYDTDYYVFVRS